MSFRPSDWAPLAEVDPLPGDPEAIFDEAARLRNMAVGIRDQAARLRRIGADQSSTGKSVAELRAAAVHVAGKLELVAERYSKVSAVLGSWAPELEEFQAATLQVHQDALTAQTTLKQAGHADLLNPNLFTYQRMPAGGLGAVQDGPEAALAQARAHLHRILTQAADRDRHWAHQIGQAIDDGLTDGFFDHVHQWVERNKGWLDTLTDKLGWVTTAAGIAVLLIPGAGELALAVEVISLAGKISAGVNLAAHLTEVAGGDKDARFDLGMDIFALGSISAAGRLTRHLGHAAEEVRGAAAKAAGHDAAQDVRTSTQHAYDRVMADPNSTRDARLAAVHDVGTVDQRARQAEITASKEVLDAPEAEANILHVAVNGDRESANAAKDIAAMAAKHKGHEEVERLAAHGRMLARAGKANFWTATAADAVDKTGSHKQSLKEPYGQFKHWVLTGSAL